MVGLTGVSNGWMGCWSKPFRLVTGCLWTMSTSADRLNALLEPNGSLAINERGVIDGKTPRITPHPNFRNRPLRLMDLQLALQSSGVHEDSVFSGGVLDLEEGDALRLISTAVRLVTERASHGDWILRSSWLSNLGRSYKYLPGL
ncbi:hypothetical protein GOODEAATRI_003700 [Goodea atripinnis]|uniref:Uncharacterized protein n=1 Tax=Goodea atripinnis TaxID=208336 RepID=A0ABV0P1B1_9TELE